MEARVHLEICTKLVPVQPRLATLGTKGPRGKVVPHRTRWPDENRGTRHLGTATDEAAARACRDGHM